jgi:hypothetical protein
VTAEKDRRKAAHRAETPPAEGSLAPRYLHLAELRLLSGGEANGVHQPSTPTSVTLVGANRFSSGSAGTVLNLTFEYQFGSQYLLTNVATKTKRGVMTIVGFRVQPETASLETQNQFRLSGRSALQYAVLGGAIIAAIFTLVVLVICIRTKMKRRKWLWILFVLFGFGKLSVNWATGQWGVMVLAAQLFSASGTAAFFGPWIVSVSLPVGAVIFLINRRILEVTPVENGGAVASD